MKKILLSVGILAVVGAIVVGATGAFYGDTETSTGNTFTAGSIELKVDSTSHYNGMICTNNLWIPSDNPGEFGDPVGFPVEGSACDGTWDETDLEGGIHTFFNFDDLKPGDHGENTISLHVYDNDAWGQFVIAPTRDADNTCTDPEVAVEGDECNELNGDGEIDDYLLFTGWLDQGLVAGFQNGDKTPSSTGWDSEEGDNIQNPGNPLEQAFWPGENINNLTHDIAEVLSEAYNYSCAGNESVSADGHNDYNLCHGLASDGRMVGSTTYYFGLAWDFPLDSGNDAQTDEYTADLTFQVEQHRNQSNPFSD